MRQLTVDLEKSVARIPTVLTSIGRPSVLRHSNALNILQLLRASTSCSRADLVRASGLSAPTVTNVIRDLQKFKLVEPLGEGESSGGRPPDMIRFKAETGCVLAVEISAKRISFLLANLNGEELERYAVSLSGVRTTPDAVCKYISKAIRSLLRNNNMTEDQLLAVVAGVPAITNAEDGVVLSISTLEGWRSVPLRELLNKTIPALTMIENDTNLAAMGEHYAGAAKGEKDFILISIGANLSAGIVLNHHIHHGSQWSAGEIGYLRLPYTSRRPPMLHEFGELESVLSSAGIAASWKDGVEKTDAKIVVDSNSVDALTVLGLAAAGNARARKIVRYRASLVADMVTNLCLVLNPGLVLLTGEIGSHPELIRWVREQLTGSEFARSKIRAGELGSEATLWGGIATALDKIPEVLLPTPRDSYQTSIIG